MSQTYLPVAPHLIHRLLLQLGRPSWLFLLLDLGSTLLVQGQNAQQHHFYQHEASHFCKERLQSLKWHHFCARWQADKSHSIQQLNTNVGRARLPLPNVCANIQSPRTLLSELSVGGALVLVVLEATGATGLCVRDSYCTQWCSVIAGH